jgi:hypothetical protein
MLTTKKHKKKFNKLHDPTREQKTPINPIAMCSNVVNLATNPVD